MTHDGSDGMKPILWLIAAVLPLLLPGGCATPGTSGQDVVVAIAEDYLGADRYRIRVLARHGTSEGWLERQAARRAAQVATENGAVGFNVDDRRFLDHVYTADDGTGRIRVTYQPGYDEWRNYWRFYRYGLGLEKMEREPIWIFSDPHKGRYRRVELDLVVQLRRVAAPGMIDAGLCLKRTHPYCS